jgi:hypothetical protein
MTVSQVIIVVLRQPNRADPEEMRTDPLWEFGSFGCTRCHARNLMNPNKVDLLKGVRLAFAQGGPSGFKLVLLTDPIETISHQNFVEAKWSPENRPFKYNRAPLLINNSGECDFPLLRHTIISANCPSWEAKFASKFRSRRTPLDMDLAGEIIQVFNQQVVSSNPDTYATTYIDALPYSPPKIDFNRRQTYFNLLGKQQENDKV